MDRGDRTALTAFVASAVVGGGMAVAIKFAVLELEPVWAATLRFMGATALMLVILAIRREKLPRGRAFWVSALYGLLSFGIGFALGFYSLTQLNPGFASVVLATIPLFTLLLAVAHGQEKITPKALAGSSVAIAGIAVMAGMSLGDVPVVPLLALIAASICLAESGVLIKSLGDIHPIAVNAVGMTVATAFLLALTFVLGNEVTLPTVTDTWVALIYMIIGSVIIFTGYLTVLEHWSASRASYIVLLMPPITVLVSVLLLDESIGPAYIIGAGMVLAGVWIGAIKHHHHHHHRHLHA